ncbi:MAG: bifunctional 23S rRNA (guanine(2069)-N(7))-methyltransferase RlmK/23S rRNA (guanine(2445)-N(2))-methyltransferase RlmL [Deltaproteobacteria bacterium]|nr:bifunctional 23S rRNA (guanine(2069)-N(7))-methyltransferase RlmK/23S rRNA (guanine(2445)-N(2))-methyltransferase RlmL [Deltaproteobacteria bacterium]
MSNTLSIRKKKSPSHFTATCSSGMEDLVREEVSSFGGKRIKAMSGAVSWYSDSLESAYRMCLWSRFASRILITLASFEANNPEDLYREAGKIDWEDNFSNDRSFAVSCTLTGSKLNNSHYASLKIKDAIADRFRHHTGKRPDIDLKSPDIRINLHIEGSRATVALDLTGESLHRRGYRSEGGTAPLKETLAATIAHLSGVHKDMPADTCIMDPMCGSGTLLIEAAFISGDIAPGLLRSRFGFISWHRHRAKMWDDLVQEAISREDRSTEKQWPLIIGYDADPRAVAMARKNVINAGLKDKIIIKQRPLADISPPLSKGIILTNPPYGERMSEKKAVMYLYHCLARIFNASFVDWHMGLFTANPDLADIPGMLWQRRYRLYNGPIRCKLLIAKSKGVKTERHHTWQVKKIGVKGENIPESCTHTFSAKVIAEDFGNRLYKNCRKLMPWAERNNITCFRIYDADLPDYNMAIDIYERWVHVQEYAPPPSVPKEKAQKRFRQALQTIMKILSVDRSDLFIKIRQRQQGKAQYQKRSGSARLYTVHEGDCLFLVNFTSYLDTGLFLDHRKTRAMIAAVSEGRTFLNLFGYTGTATVYAAKGKATSTTTVDLSETYLIRAQANMYLNGYGGPLHRFVKEDCCKWLKKNQEKYGVIFIDPPTFSNVRHKNIVFDVQRDHVKMLTLAMKCLSADGILIFSTNSRKFKLDPGLKEVFRVKDITQKTIPEDFRSKTPPVHRCYEFSHKV